MVRFQTRKEDLLPVVSPLAGLLPVAFLPVAFLQAVPLPAVSRPVALLPEQVLSA